MLAAVTAIASPAVAADQFDLVCEGRDGREIERQHYRIDLERKEYCAGECERVLPIAEVTSGMITLTNRAPAPLDDQRSYNRINRATGAWAWYWSNPRITTRIQDVKGRCEPAQFSGFPGTKF